MINNCRVALSIVLAVVLGGCEHPTEPEGYVGVVELTEHRLAFETAGRVTEISVERGDHVEGGDALIRLDDALTKAQKTAKSKSVEGAEAQVSVLEAGARSSELAALAAESRAAAAQVTHLETELNRQRMLFEQGAVGAAVVDDLASELERARWELSARQQRLATLSAGARDEEIHGAKAHAEALAADVTATDLLMDRHTLKAPIAGVVLDRHVELGEVVSPGVPVVTVGDPTHPYVDVFVPQADLEGIEIGRTAKVRVDAVDEAFDAQVEHVERRTEFTPRYIFTQRERAHLVVRVRLRISDPAVQLHAGVPAFATFSAP